MSRRWAPLVAALSVVAVAVAISLVVGGGKAGEPPTLRLAPGSGLDAGVAADAPRSSGATAAGGSFELVGTLPTGPREARSHPLPGGAADAGEVRRLAAALGVVDAPKRVEGGWAAGALRVRDEAGNPWSMYAGCGPDVPVQSDGTGTSGTASSCAGGTVVTGSAGVTGGTSGTSGTAEPAPVPQPSPRPTADLGVARRAAMPILDQLGLGDADVSVQGGGEQAFVQAAPRVGSLRTFGFDTSLVIDAGGHVVGGNGYLGRPTDGPSYPLVSAKTAYDAMPALPRPMILCPANADCPQPGPVKVTGAQLGLMLTPLADRQAALLPAWLFTIEGWTAPLAQPAIERRFLQLPTPVPVGPGSTPMPPAMPPQPAEPTAPRSSFGFDAAFPTDQPNALIVQYGDSSSCPHTNVEPLVKESPDSIVVTLEGDTLPANRACTADYRQRLVTLKLTAPLGDRTVIDGSRGKAVPVDRTCARPMGQPSPPSSCRP